MEAAAWAQAGELVWLAQVVSPGHWMNPRSAGPRCGKEEEEALLGAGRVVEGETLIVDGAMAQGHYNVMELAGSGIGSDEAVSGCGNAHACAAEGIGTAVSGRRACVTGAQKEDPTSLPGWHARRYGGAG